LQVFPSFTIKNNNILKVKHLSVKKEDIYYLHNINFNLKKGQVLTIIGESGSGKTLLAKTIISFLPQNFFLEKGEIELGSLKLINSNINKIRGKHIYYLSQDSYNSFDPTFKIKYQLKEFLNTKNLSYNKNKIIKIMSELGFETPVKTLNLYPFQLSGGMLQRVSIARALLAGADIIIADEPTSGLDIELQIDFVKLLDKIVKLKKLSLIFITHNLKIVKEFDKTDTIVIYAGYIIEQNPSIIEQPYHPYTKGLIESMPSKWEKGTPIKTMKGFIPEPKKSFSRCVFYPRCKSRIEKCKKNFPNLIEKKTNLKVRCLLYK